MPLRNPFRRQDDAPTLRDRAADLSARLASAIRKPAAAPADEPESEAPSTIEEFAGLEFSAYTLDDPVKTPQQWADKFAAHAMMMHVADRTLRMIRVVLREVAGLNDATTVSEFHGNDFGPDTHIAELAAEFCRVYGRHAVKDRAHMAGELAEKEWLPSYQATVALMEKLEATRPKTLLGTALKCLGAIGMAGWNARADGSTDGMDPWERVGVQFQDALMADALAPISIAGPDLVGLVDFSAASMDELRAIHDVTNEVSAFAYALVSSGCGSVQDPRSYNERLKPAGNLMLWVAEALSSIEDTAYNEIKRRKPADHREQETRLRVLASMLIGNGDKAETAAFARELLAFAGE